MYKIVGKNCNDCISIKYIKVPEHHVSLHVYNIAIHFFTLFTQVHRLKKSTNGICKGKTLVKTIACLGYCEHNFERSGSIIYQYFDTYVTCHRLVANCFQREEEGRCLGYIYAE